MCGPDYDAKESYTYKEMAQEPLILLETNSNSRRFLDEKFMENGAELKPQIEIAAYDLLIRFASIHLGVSCVVEEFSKESLEKGLIRPMKLEPPLEARGVGCAYMRNNPLSLAAQAFLKLIREDRDTNEK